MDRQLSDCRELAARHGWSVVDVLRDDSRSAWKRDRKRPGWEALLDGIKADRYDAVVVWHGDRLVRQPYDLEALLRLVEDRPSLQVASLAGTRDLTSPDDRFVLRIEVAAACRESDSTARRVRRALAEHAEHGRRHGEVPYGWRSDDEAAVVRRIVRGLLSGEVLRQMSATLNAEGVPAPKGGPWSPTQVRLVALRPANAGLRVHRGEVVGEASWPSLVSRDEHDRVTRLLRDPARRTSAGTASKHLLSGLVACGRCGGPLMHAKTHNGRAIYRCNVNLCTSTTAATLDELVVDRVLAVLSSPEARAALTPGDEPARKARANLAVLESRKESLAEDYVDGLLSREQLKAANARLDARISVAEAEVRRHDRRSVLDDLPGDLVAQTWAGLSLARRRAVIRELFTLTLMPAQVRGGRMDPDRLKVAPRAAV